MDNLNYRSSLPVLLFYNIDPQWSSEDIRECLTMVDLLADGMVEAGHPVTRACLEDENIPSLLRQHNPDEVIVFNWCEEVPGIPRSSALAAEGLEKFGFTYTGAGADALLLSQDKRKVKRRLQARGIPTPTWRVYEIDYVDGWKYFPAIVKPAFEHCSVGITREAVVQSPTELLSRIRYVLDEFQQPALVEEFVDGREFHVGLLGNRRIKVLPPAEIDFSSFSDIHDRLCTYEANFNRESPVYWLTMPKLPAQLKDGELAKLFEVVTEAYRVTDCRDYARMDIRLRDGIFYVLDVNPNADISPETSLIKAAEMSGYSYGQFGSLLVNMAARRHPCLKYPNGEKVQ